MTKTIIEELKAREMTFEERLKNNPVFRAEQCKIVDEWMRAALVQKNYERIGKCYEFLDTYKDKDNTAVLVDTVVSESITLTDETNTISTTQSLPIVKDKEEIVIDTQRGRVM